MRSSPRSAALLLVLTLAGAGCPSSDDEGGEGSLVVGVQADDFGGAVGPVHIVAKIDGVSAADETVDLTSPTSPLPKEIQLRGAPGARVDVTVDGFVPGSASGAPIVERTAASRLVPNDRKLLRLRLEQRCTNPTGSPGLVPACDAPLTCIAGACASNEVGPLDLEDYEPGWAAAPPDICRPKNHGAPEVILGTGQTDYAPLADGQVLQLEKGPQGGHHIWIAARMRNLRQSGSVTTVSSKLEGDPSPVPPASVVFSFDRDEGAYCKLWGIRYQVDVDVPDLRVGYKRFLGKALDVTVEVVDSTGARAASSKRVQIADKLLCADGTDACNQP